MTTQRLVVCRPHTPHAGSVEIVVDGSTLISLLARLPLTPVVLVRVRDEAVVRGQQGGHADATAIASALGDLEPRPDAPGRTVDDRVLAAAVEVGALAADDLAPGRRATNQGARWLRTADLVLLGDRTGTVGREERRAAIGALHHAGHITDDIRDHCWETLP